MTDSLSRKRRSWNMSRIRATNTRPEKILRSQLHRLGFRFSLHNRSLLGCPDIVLRKYRTVIFVHGCFWHRHPRCKFAYEPKSNRAFWFDKFDSNVQRDKKVRQALRRLGWRVVVVWECQILKDPAESAARTGQNIQKAKDQ